VEVELAFEDCFELLYAVMCLHYCGNWMCGDDGHLWKAKWRDCDGGTIPRTCRWEVGMLIISAYQVDGVSKVGIGIREDSQDKISQEERTNTTPTP
jgi:hypothetical protein